MDERSWPSKFFSGHPPEWVETVEAEQGEFRTFGLDGRKWTLGKSVSQVLCAGPNCNRVLQVVIKYQDQFFVKYVAKVFPEYTIEDAKAQLRRIPCRRRKVEDVRDELDTFCAEARAFRRIDELCTSSERTYFPRFHGVVTDLDASKFEYGYVNRRAIILEVIHSRLVSRRILAADHPSCGTEYAKRFSQRLRDSQVQLSDLEEKWYVSLFADRLRRLMALHRIGITHGDVRDDHFRLPKEFYDSVLYDFSIAYTFTPVKPYRMNCFRPLSLETMSKCEFKQLEDQVYER
ncbi:hypothetical protein BDW42DRAFT_192558 [Aspergillus taichungensis]|uniref:Protein kinase domain-containing protein n=1 Tax=Aspergillus taichungensis TaxID=482145 RepID=A0A2J5HZP8_9EURO|nr:hypothetical protein BDW42DRAFT_192558 [Aspergillus taichungensis]